MKDLLTRIQEKKAQLDQGRPIPALVLEQIKHDIALEWTYNSNAIEGNTLTLQETRLVLEEGITIKGKSLREHFEAKNHEKAIKYLEDLVEQKEGINEEQVFNIHAFVLENIEADFLGRYRNGQVRIVGANFVPPAGHKVPDLMEAFVSELQEQKDTENILDLAVFAHHRFVWIHPFFDGNGRTARLLMNLLFMRAGYPPAVILRNDRKKYYEALNQANNGNMEKLTLLIGQALERSLDLYLSAFTSSDEEEYLPLSMIAPQTPYSAEYLGLLARRGLIDAYKNGRNWVSSVKAVKAYYEPRS